MKTENKTILIHHPDLEILWIQFRNIFKVKEAGGGVVINKNNEILFIKRRGLWDLPKGHREKGEQIETTAIREVEEECGIKNLSIIKQLKTSYHTYWLKGKAILKPTFWFLMHYTENNLGKPQVEEEITEIRWFSSKDLYTALSNTFPSIKDTINDYFANPDA